MKRSIGVTVIAVLSMLGSLFTLLMGVLVATVPFLASMAGPNKPPFPPGIFPALMLLGAVMYILPSIWGIFTSIGLFRLKNWARISIIVFAVLLVLMCGFGGLMVLVIPMPPTPNQPTDANITTAVHVFMATFAGVMISIGIWWLVFFTRSKVKEQFVPTPPLTTDVANNSIGLTPGFSAQPNKPYAPRIPASLTVIACLLLAGCFFIPISLWLRSPGIFLKWVLTGWPATVYFVIFCLVHLYVGIGLLRLKPFARIVGIAYYAFLFVNMSVFYGAPGSRSRVLDMLQKSQASMPWIQGQDAQYGNPMLFMSSTPFLILMAVSGLLWILVPLYFLVTRKEAFEKAAAAANRSLSSLV